MGEQSDGRLDLLLMLVLDEVVLICLILLDEWFVDMGGCNVIIYIGI